MEKMEFESKPLGVGDLSQPWQPAAVIAAKTFDLSTINI
jgi:hypothetical protein